MDYAFEIWRDTFLALVPALAEARNAGDDEAEQVAVIRIASSIAEKAALHVAERAPGRDK